ncbi:MAG: STAS domain-containing protein [Candidatus Sericytochromatia bacterium]
MTTSFAEPSAGRARDRLTFSTEWETSSVVRISTTGEIDASNATRLADYVFQRSANCLELVLDLREVEFFGSAGLTTLINIHERCAQANVRWTVLPSRAVSRVLDICDPEHTLPRATA